MDTKTLPKTTAPSATQAIAPEDLRPGDYLALTHATYQLLPEGPAGWCAKLQPQTIRLIPCDAGEAQRVLAVCLPFVLVRSSAGFDRTLDLRRHEMRRLDAAFGKQAFRDQDKKAGKDKPGKSGKADTKRRKRKRK